MNAQERLDLWCYQLEAQYRDMMFRQRLKSIVKRKRLSERESWWEREFRRARLMFWRPMMFKPDQRKWWNQSGAQL